MKIIINENQSFVLRRLSYVDEIMTTKFESIYSDKMMEYNCDEYDNENTFFDVVFQYVFEMFYHKYLSHFGLLSISDTEILESYYDIINTYLEEKYGNLIRNRYSDNCP
jgi:hypothetical protein